MRNFLGSERGGSPRMPLTLKNDVFLPGLSRVHYPMKVKVNPIVMGTPLVEIWRYQLYATRELSNPNSIL